MNLRPLLLAATVTALLASGMALDAKNAPRTAGLSGSSRSAGPDGTPTLVVNVPVTGVSTNNACGTATPGAGNTVVSVNLGPNAVVTGIGANGTFTSFTPSWRSEVLAVLRGVNPAENLQLGFSSDDSPGVATFNFAPIDITGAGFANITTGSAGVFNIELCEDFPDTSVTPDATFGATTLQVACFNCTDPFALPPAVSAPTLSTWSILALVLSLGLVGAAALRRYS